METYMNGYWFASITTGFVLSSIIVLLTVKDKEEFGSIALTFYTIIFSIILGNFILLEEFKIKEVEAGRIHLLSLKTIGLTEGNMFAIYSGEQYSGFVKTKNGYIKIILPGNSELIPDKNVFYSKICTTEMRRLYIPLFYKGEWKKSDFFPDSSCRSEIHLPKNSIQFEYKVD